MKFRFTRRDFPEDFVFGTATSSYQIEGHGVGGAGLTHWDTFAATPGNVVRRENGLLACDHYHRFESDLDLVAGTGLDAYRFSTSWARVLPNGTGTPNETGLDFYDRLVDAMLKRGLKPFATLYHWELPAVLADRGGWTNPDIADWFADFANVVMRRIGDRVQAVAPINEPWCVAWLSHFLGMHAPGQRDIRAASRAMHHVLLAHGKAIQVMRSLSVKNLGAILNFEYAQALDTDPQSQKAATLYDGIYNRWFLDGLFLQRYPDDVLAGLEQHLPHGWHNDFDTIGTPIDWVGVNYYTRKIIGSDDGAGFPEIKESVGALPTTSMGWEIFPEGLYHFLTRVQEKYACGLPIYVTENGMSHADFVIDDQVNDVERISYLNQHFAEAQRAIKDGVNLKGYFVWSLLDNFEWSLGYDKRFGLVHVDFKTMKRTPKASYHALADALAHPRNPVAPVTQ